MKRATLYLVLLLLTFSCQPNPETTAEKLMGDWYKRKIDFPENLTLVSKGSPLPGKGSTNESSQAKYKVLHYFTADCDKCINELLRAQNFIQKHKTQKEVEYVFIACGPTDVYVQEAIKASGFEHPVYFDQEYFGFKILNDLPINDNMYNTMLLNEQNEVLLFGSVFDNEKAEKLFFDIVSYHSVLAR